MSVGRGLALALAVACAACSDQAVPSPAVGGAGSSAIPAAGAAGEMAIAGGAGAGLAAAGGSAGAAASNSAGVAGVGGSAGAAGASGGGSGPIVPVDGPASSRQTERPLGTTPAMQGFYEYLPPGYGGMPRPVLVFFHGGGERGNGTTELSKLLVHGPPWLISKDEWPAERPFVVLSPQHSSEIGGCPDADEVQTFLSFALANYAIDPKRVYLTGLSCGGHAIWRYLGKYGGKSLAATVPICGDGRDAWTMGGCGMAGAALWAFHGDADPTVLPVGTTETVAHLLECPQPPRKEIKMTMFPGVQHESWPPVYDLSAGQDIYTWMLANTATPE